MAMHFSEEDKEKFEKENPEIYKKRTAETEKEEIENLSRSGKLRYFFDYYFKGILAVFIVVCILVVLFIKNLSREPSDALYVVIRHDIIMDDKVMDAFLKLRDFMTDNLYFNPVCKSEEVKADAMLSMLYDHYISHPDDLPDEYIRLMQARGEDPGRIVCDYISGMTDVYSVQIYEKLFVPKFWEK